MRNVEDEEDSDIEKFKKDYGKQMDKMGEDRNQEPEIKKDGTDDND